MPAAAYAISLAVLSPAKTAGSRATWSVILPSAMAEPDADVIQAVLDGENDRYAELVERYQDFALRLALGLLGNDEDARDAAQEAFISAYRSLSTFRARAKFSTWLYRIVINECKDVYRRRARQPMIVARAGGPEPELSGEEYWIDVEDPSADPTRRAANHELARHLQQAMTRLPPKQRTAFVLHHLQGLPLEDVAAIMNCRAGTVKAHIFRATTTLRTALQPWLPKEDR